LGEWITPVSGEAFAAEIETPPAIAVAKQTAVSVNNFLMAHFPSLLLSAHRYERQFRDNLLLHAGLGRVIPLHVLRLFAIGLRLRRVSGKRRSCDGYQKGGDDSGTYYPVHFLLLGFFCIR
jgi:hypothetical protein